ncbi:MAG: CoA-transferase [Pseudomonadota bacterium]|nr:CoA-transferase [Pseudomonadota bacterium]MEA3241053.1 CoA-transferase [Pseudomonadota bacterium]
MSESDKCMSMVEAIRRFVKPETHLSVGGFTLNRNPMAAVYEIIRQRLSGLHIYAHSNGQGVDELIGAGCVRAIEIAYGGNGRFAPTCIRFRKAIETGQINFEDYSNYQMTLRFMAGAMGVPFLPTTSGLGTDILQKWGFSPEFREAEARLPREKLLVMDNPFRRRDEDSAKVVLLPAINPDVTIIHVQKAGRQGTVCIDGLTFADVEQAKAARHLIVSCEKLVEEEEMRLEPGKNQLPFFLVDAVVLQPYGAYPTACYGCYDYDPQYLKMYRQVARDDVSYSDYLEEYVYGVENHERLCDLVGSDSLQRIKADSPQGYAAGLERS